MRRPTPPDVYLAWWSDAMGYPVSAAGRRHLRERHPDDAECGFFRLRIKPGAPYAPARIWLHQEIDPETGELTADEDLRGEIDGRPMRLPEMERRWTHLRAVSEHDFLALMAARHRPDATGVALRATHARFQPKGFITP